MAAVPACLSTAVTAGGVLDMNKLPHCPAEDRIAREMTVEINRARGMERVCGGQRYAAAAPVRWNSTLAHTAAQHAGRMAEQDRIGHTLPAEDDLGVRVRTAGYTWRAVGENIAAGQATTAATVASWLESRGHCTNIMNPAFREIGAACARNASSRYGTYWTLVLAAPGR